MLKERCFIQLYFSFKFEMSWMICFWPLLKCPSDSLTNVSKSSSSETSACCFCFPLLDADIVYIKDFDMKVKMEENLKRNFNLISLQHGALNFAAISVDDRWPMSFVCPLICRRSRPCRISEFYPNRVLYMCYREVRISFAFQCLFCGDLVLLLSFTNEHNFLSIY